SGSRSIDYCCNSALNGSKRQRQEKEIPGCRTLPSATRPRPDGTAQRGYQRLLVVAPSSLRTTQVPWGHGRDDKNLQLFCVHCSPADIGLSHLCACVRRLAFGGFLLLGSHAHSHGGGGRRGTDRNHILYHWPLLEAV